MMLTMWASVTDNQEMTRVALRILDVAPMKSATSDLSEFEMLSIIESANGMIESYKKNKDFSCAIVEEELIRLQKSFNKESQLISF
jgi:hypothetical protein